MIFLPADNVEPNRAILISAMISFKISRARDFETKRFRDQEISRPRDLKTKRSQDQDWRSNNDASIDSRRKSASWKTACVFHSGGHRDERNEFTPRQLRLRNRPLRGEGRGLVTEKMELRSPHYTEAEVVDDADGRAVVAPRRAAAVGAAAPAAAARQTVGTCRRSCGVCHAS